MRGVGGMTSKNEDLKSPVISALSCDNNLFFMIFLYMRVKKLSWRSAVPEK